jgi:hypothetical protein
VAGAGWPMLCTWQCWQTLGTADSRRCARRIGLDATRCVSSTALRSTRRGFGSSCLSRCLSCPHVVRALRAEHTAANNRRHEIGTIRDLLLRLGARGKLRGRAVCGRSACLVAGAVAMSISEVPSDGRGLTTHGGRTFLSCLSGSLYHGILKVDCSSFRRVRRGLSVNGQSNCRALRDVKYWPKPTNTQHCAVM